MAPARVRTFLLKFVAITALLLILWPWLAPGYSRGLAGSVIGMLHWAGFTGTLTEVTGEGFLLHVRRGLNPGREVPLHLGAITANWIPFVGLILAGPLKRKSTLMALVLGMGVLALSHVIMIWLICLTTILSGKEKSGPLSLLFIASSLSTLWPFLLWLVPGPGLEILGLSRHPGKRPHRTGDNRPLRSRR